MNFTAFPLDPRVAAGVTACGYETATPIQAQAIPPALAGRDVLGLAQTGTGKTAAYALPILNRLVGGRRGALRALVVAPTRELAEQIRWAFQQLGGRTGLRATTIYGGVGMGRQVEALRRGADIAVGCPGRLLDHIGQRTMDLRQLEVLVLDEADMMLDMGFLPDVRRILGHVPSRRQSLLFSATMPAEIRSLAGELLRDAVTIAIRHSAPAETVSHALYPVAQHLKTALLLEILTRTETGSVLVFTRTKHRARRLGEQLVRAGHRAASLQGNLSQAARQAALGGFREGRHRILVATDIAARGLDVSRVSHVINFDMPGTSDAYTHRIGRTGRAERPGDAFTLVTAQDGPRVREIERVLGATIERRHIEGFDYKQRSAATTEPSALRPTAPEPRVGQDDARTARLTPPQGPRTTHPRVARASHRQHTVPASPPIGSARATHAQRHPTGGVPRDNALHPRHAQPCAEQPRPSQTGKQQPRLRVNDRRAVRDTTRGHQQDSRDAASLNAHAPRTTDLVARQTHQAYSPDAVQGFNGHVYSARDPYVSHRESSVWPWRDKGRGKASHSRKSDDHKD